MNIEHVAEFAVVADCLNFSKAGELLYISQSSLSKHIMALEKELGQELFVRKHRDLQLTEAGKLFYPYAQQIAAAYQRSLQTLREFNKAQSNTFDFGLAASGADYLTYPYLADFMERYPQYTIHVVEAEQTTLAEMFRNHELNLFTTAKEGNPFGDFCFLPARTARIVAALHRDHPLAAKTALDWTDLISEQLILPPKYSLPNNLVSARFAAMNAKPKVAYEGSFSSGARTLNHINCICLTIEEMVKRMPFQEDIVIRPVLPAQTYVYGLAYRQPGTLSAGERLFVDYIAERAEQEREKENKSAE
ncbi:MAG: LysR family transcriptional regulator [Clostridia bacterium]|nr:LysR family transcriptional regulator [Clostridia bacterium]